MVLCSRFRTIIVQIYVLLAEIVPVPKKRPFLFPVKSLIINFETQDINFVFSDVRQKLNKICLVNNLSIFIQRNRQNIREYIELNLCGGNVDYFLLITYLWEVL